jgi:hypothetical protein
VTSQRQKRAVAANDDVVLLTEREERGQVRGQGVRVELDRVECGYDLFAVSNKVLHGSMQ